MRREPDDRVGVRELRQNLSVYLDRVKGGARLEVTEHGRPVAMLVPLSPQDDPLARMVADGRVVPSRGSLAEYLRRQPSTPIDGSNTLTAALLTIREQERG